MQLAQVRPAFIWACMEPLFVELYQHLNNCNKLACAASVFGPNGKVNDYELYMLNGYIEHNLPSA